MPGRGNQPRTTQFVVVTIALLATAWATSVRSARAQQVRQSAAAATTPATRSDTAPPDERRRFAHSRHEGESCLTCHGAGANHRTLLVRTPRDCASCHHDERRARTCGACHANRLPATRAVKTTVKMSVWPEPRERTLPFAHRLHLDERTRLECKDCHRADAMLASDRACTSCHERHHRPEADCSSCHVAPESGVHTADVHRSCAGAGCHAAEVAPSPTGSRTLCLVCHAAQKSHKAGKQCASCHLLADARSGTTQPRNERGLMTELVVGSGAGNVLAIPRVTDFVASAEIHRHLDRGVPSSLDRTQRRTDVRHDGTFGAAPAATLRRGSR